MKLLLLILLGVIAWLINRLMFITKAYRDDLNDVRHQLLQLQQQRPLAVAGQQKPENTEKININTASKTRLQSLPGIGTVSAQRIIDARPYSSIDDLRRVEGVKADPLDELICV